MRRWGRTTWAAVLVAGLSGIVAAWPPLPPAPGTLLNLPLGTFGPYDTAKNHGYESSQHVSPIVPQSYTAFQGPELVGLQFIGDSRTDLRDDNFRIAIQGGSYTGSFQSANAIQDGFAGLRLNAPLSPGTTYRVTFDVTGFAADIERWNVAVRAKSTPWDRSAVSSMAYRNALNTLRSPLHLSPLKWSERLERASVAHAAYLARHGYAAPSFHDESSSEAGFTGSTPWSRDLAFGWPNSLSGEVGIEWSHPADPLIVTADLGDTVFHRLSLLSGNLGALGEGQTAGRHGAVVMDLGFGYQSRLPHAVAYPYPGQPGVSIGWVDIESPDPVKGGYGHRFGYPITVDFPTVDSLSEVHVGLWRGRLPVPLYVDHPGIGDTAQNQIGLVPRRQLLPNSEYRAMVSAEALFNDGTVRPVKLGWCFATGGAPDTVAAEVESGVRAKIADVVAGSGVPVGGEVMTLYRRRTGRPLSFVGRGKTNGQGLWIATRFVPKPGYYEAVAGSGNATVFWWGRHG